MTRTVIVNGRLAECARQINEHHERAVRNARESLAAACYAGRWLLQAKEECAHGEWLPWLKANVHLSERTAQAYMRLAREWDTLEKSATVADLTLKGALELLTDRREEQHHDGEPLGEQVEEPAPLFVNVASASSATEPKQASRPEQRPAQEQAEPVAQPAHPPSGRFAHSDRLWRWLGYITSQLDIIQLEQGGIAGMLADKGKWDRELVKEGIIPCLDDLIPTLVELREEIAAGFNGPQPSAKQAGSSVARRGVGMEHAYEAVECLKRIPKNDPLRVEGLKFLEGWVRQAMKG